MGNIVPIGGITKLDLPVETVLEAAKKHLDSVVIIGFDKKGKTYFTSTIADGGDVIWLLEACKNALFSQRFPDAV
jgi:hypothetical protein